MKLKFKQYKIFNTIYKINLEMSLVTLYLKFFLKLIIEINS
jgi:hypothetical protein